MDIGELALMVGRIDQKQDEQTIMLKDIKASTTDLSTRVASLEDSRGRWQAAWRYTKLGVLTVAGWLTGKHFNG